ncbi:PREDICTED: putative F-box protein At3g17620 [Camelina sativa]|uniref:F-box protein At3g17620 n=1 Tax=Camelina sativa TaxID=90675 RepID=A0ABM0W4L3_CAMSA|nr:PREDICTED: putative F-box protein At3g17620 [Camelina sativa]
MKMMISNLPTELVEEILSRVPVTSTGAVRLTCKKWNTLSKDESFTKKHLAQVVVRREVEQLQAIVLLNYSLYPMSIDRIHYNDFDPSVKFRANLVSLNDSDKLVITRVYHCEGLVLCLTEDYTRLVVWNPYTGQTRWIRVELRSDKHRGIWYNHALGYDKSNNHKILRYLNVPGAMYVHEIYDLNSSSWRVLDVTPDWDVQFDNYGLSLKGNTYWYATDKVSREDIPDFLLCFDFTTERFGPRLHLPFDSYSEDAVVLSSVREEQLAVLYQHCETHEMEIWITNKIEPNALSWSKFLAVDMDPLTGFRFYSGGSFLVDEEKRVVVVFDEDKNVSETNRNTAYFIGENGYFREVDLGEITTAREIFPHAFSYVPSSVFFESESDEKR